jgi:hypothetical protein
MLRFRWDQYAQTVALRAGDEHPEELQVSNLALSDAAGNIAADPDDEVPARQRQEPLWGSGRKQAGRRPGRSGFRNIYFQLRDHPLR